MQPWLTTWLPATAKPWVQALPEWINQGCEDTGSAIAASAPCEMQAGAQFVARG